MSKPLLPCPFCGQSDIVISDSDELMQEGAYGYFAVCCGSNGHPGCGAATGWSQTKVEAARRWNTRKT